MRAPHTLTFAVLIASYELCVRRTWVGVMLNGQPKVETVPDVVVVGGRVAVPEPRLAARPAAEPRAKPKAAIPNRTGTRPVPRHGVPTPK